LKKIIKAAAAIEDLQWFSYSFYVRKDKGRKKGKFYSENHKADELTL